MKTKIEQEFFHDVPSNLHNTSEHPTYREAKFKRALRVHFLTHLTKNFCHFLTREVKSGTDMINPSIESADFLFWHEKIWSRHF